MQKLYALLLSASLVLVANGAHQQWVKVSVANKIDDD
jgi:hypothetical protein